MKKCASILIMFFLICCSDKEPPHNKLVDDFISEIVVGEYDGFYLPDFEPSHIPFLLSYADNFQEIDYYPINPISSYYPPKFRLGECLLWTIESIRIGYGEESRYKKYPSMVPVLQNKNYLQNNYYWASEEELQEAYELYYQWWHNNKSLPFESFQLADPLIDSDYTWNY